MAARTDMANGATIAGLALANAFVGANHALAHAVGARFGIAHGRANALFLPSVLAYNAAVPSKFMPAPGYGAYVVPAKYAEMARALGLGSTPEALPSAFGASRLLAALGMPRSAADAGIDPAAYRAALPRAGGGGVRRPQPAHEPADAAGRRAAPAARVRRLASRRSLSAPAEFINGSGGRGRAGGGGGRQGPGGRLF